MTVAQSPQCLGSFDGSKQPAPPGEPGAQQTWLPVQLLPPLQLHVALGAQLAHLAHVVARAAVGHALRDARAAAAELTGGALHVAAQALAARADLAGAAALAAHAAVVGIVGRVGAAGGAAAVAGVAHGAVARAGAAGAGERRAARVAAHAAVGVVGARVDAGRAAAHRREVAGGAAARARRPTASRCRRRSRPRSAPVQSVPVVPQSHWPATQCLAGVACVIAGAAVERIVSVDRRSRRPRSSWRRCRRPSRRRSGRSRPSSCRRVGAQVDAAAAAVQRIGLHATRTCPRSTSGSDRTLARRSVDRRGRR